MKHVKKYAILFLMVFALALMTNTKAEAATVAKIGGRSYSSLKTAIRRVRNNQTIKLMRNVTLKKQLVISNNKKFTINLNRHTIRMSRGKKGGFMYESGSLKIDKRSKVTLKNGTIKATHRDYRQIFDIREKASLTIKSGTYAGIISNYGKLTIKKGSFTEEFAHDALIWNLGTLTIADGNFIQKTVSADVICNLHNCTIKGGSFRCASKGICVDTYQNMNYSHTVKTAISGGPFVCTQAGDDHETGYTLKVANKANVTISGGDFQEQTAVWDGTVTMTGGKISSEGKAAVRITGGTFVMNGGDVSVKQYSRNGAPCAVAMELTYQGNLELNKGTITGGLTYTSERDGKPRYSPVVWAEKPDRVKLGTDFTIINNGGCPADITNTWEWM